MVGRHTRNIGYIDDTTAIAIGDSEAQNFASLEQEFWLTCVPWSTTHASVFASDKFQVVHHYCPVRPRRKRRRSSGQPAPGLGPDPTAAASRPKRSTRRQRVPLDRQSDDSENSD